MVGGAEKIFSCRDPRRVAGSVVDWITKSHSGKYADGVDPSGRAAAKSRRHAKRIEKQY